MIFNVIRHPHSIPSNGHKFCYQTSCRCLLYIERATNNNVSAAVKPGRKKEALEMKTIKEISKWLRGAKGSGMNFAPGIDSHKWENQMEIRHLISSKPDARVMATLHNGRTCTT
jgi:hypothetical protein